MWEFAVPIILTKIFTDSLLPASVFPFSTQLACIVFGTLVGTHVFPFISPYRQPLRKEAASMEQTAAW